MSGITPRRLPPFVIVDGSSGVGKTVTADALSRRLGAGPAYPEHYLYLDQAKNETLPPRDIRGLHASLAIWQELELRRQSDRLANAPPDGTVQVVDCSIVSVLAFEIAKARFGFVSAVQELAALLWVPYRDKTLEEPAGWIFLAAPADVVLDRIRQRGGSLTFLKNADVIGYIDRIREIFADQFLQPHEYLWIENSERSLASVVEEATVFTCGLPTDGRPTAIQEFLRVLAQDAGFTSSLCGIDL